MRRSFLTVIEAVLTLGFSLYVQGQGNVECMNYKFLNDSDRAQTFITPLGSPKCDISLSGWYRFGGKAGNKMADSCVSRNLCGTYAAGWLSGGHPSVPDGAVGRKVCFSYTGGCCHYEARITVRNCGEFYVYHLKRAPSCYLRYCGNGLSPTPVITPSVSPSVVSSSLSVFQSPLYSPDDGESPNRIPECSKYTFLNDSTRATTYSNITVSLCDSNLLIGWYRFGGRQESQMPESCVPIMRCGAAAPGWLNGVHPTVADGEVSRKVCFHWTNNCCKWSVNIKVRNCGGFYVYKHLEPPLCSGRYCVKGLPPTTATTPKVMTPPDLLIPTPSVTTTPNLLGIKGLHLTVYKSKVNVGSRITITCVVIGGPDNPNITWTKGENLIGLSHRTKVETRKRHSNLTIRDVMAKDAGRYRCQARAEKMRSRYIDVWVLPVLGIRPRKVTKRIGEQATFHCSGFRGFRGANVSIVEVTRKESEVRYNKVSFTATTLQIPQGKESHVRKFVCEISSPKPNFVKRSEVAELTIVSQDSPRCPGESLEGVSWSHTVGGGMDEKPCPNGATGTASRKCSQEGAWKKANFAGCSSAEFNKLNYTMEAIVGGFQSDLNAQQVLAQLANASRPKKDDSERPPQLYGGDLVIAVDILAKMAQYNAIQGSVSSTEDLTNYAKVASNLLDSTNNRTWKELEKAGQAKSQILVKAMDDYGFGISATFNKTTESMVAETKNLAMSIFRVDEDSPLREEGIKVAYKQSSIYLPPQAFSSSSNSRIVTLVYLTLNDVLPLALENTNGDDQPLSANTTIVSAAVDPRPPDMLNKPVKIVLQNRKTSASSGVNPQGKCVFWRPEESAIWNTSGCRLISSESEVTMTTCECDHLTIFAALMDPYGTQTTKALEIISIVGCSISLLAVLITMTFTVCFWRALKSPRAKVLLNLCVAIAITCALAIFEGLARKKTGCPVVAALLHYFLLALFSWMLCEGILHYLLLVKVFGGGAGNKLKYFYMLGWGFPAIIVTISLAVTQANGYGNAAACWLDVESGLIWAFIAPALLVIVINIVVFILVIRQMMGSMSMKDKTQIERVGAGVKASAVILPLLGITWLFGLLSFSSNTNAFKYIFAIFNSLQGLMIFTFHCVLNKQVQDAMKRRLEKGNTGFSSNANSRPPSGQNAKLLLVNPPAKKAVIKRTRGAQYDDEQLPQTREVFKDTLELNTLLDKEDINRVNEEEPLEGSSHIDE